MPLFCTNQGVIESNYVFTPSLDYVSELVPLNFGVGGIQFTEASAFKFKDSDSGFIWNTLTPSWLPGRMVVPIHIDDYIYYLSKYRGETGDAELYKVLYSLGSFGEPEIMSVPTYGSYIKFLYIDGYFYLFSNSHVSITSNFITYTEHAYLITPENIIYFKGKFHSIGIHHYSSVDGYTWIDEGALSFEIFKYAQSDTILIGINETQMITFDGLSWSIPINLPIIINESLPIPWLNIAYNNNVFCLVGAVYGSPDTSIIGISDNGGSSWQTQTIPNLYLNDVVPMYPAKFWQLFVQTTES